MRRALPLVFCLFAFSMLMPDPAAAQPHPFTAGDLIAMDRLSEPVVSPDGTTIVFMQSSLDLDANRRRSDLWLVKTDGSGLRQLTTDPASDSSPVWHPDGTAVFFSSSRSGSRCGA